MRKGFTMVELLVVIGIIAVLVAILVPVVTSAIGDTHRTACQGNLRTIGKAFAEYRQKHEDRPFPTHRIDARREAGDPDDITVETGLNMDDDLADIGDCAMNAVWPMLDEGMLPIHAFQCPADKFYEGRSESGAGTKYGWSKTRQFSFGIHNPYAGDGDNDSAACPNRPDPNDPKRWTYKPNYVVMADFNPTGGLEAKLSDWVEHSNHTNRGKGGISTVTWVGNVSFHNKPNSDAGFGDDIYIDEDGEDVWVDYDGVPDSKSDTVITPRIDKEKRKLE